MKTRYLLTFLTAMAFLADASGVLAQTPDPTRMDQAQALLKKRFAAADSNHDGKLTLEEAKAGGMPRVVKNFDEIDADHKGYVTLDDIKLFAAQKLAEHKAEGNDP